MQYKFPLLIVYCISWNNIFDTPGARKCTYFEYEGNMRFFFLYIRPTLHIAYHFYALNSPSSSKLCTCWIFSVAVECLRSPSNAIRTRFIRWLSFDSASRVVILRMQETACTREDRVTHEASIMFLYVCVTLQYHVCVCVVPRNDLLAIYSVSNISRQIFVLAFLTHAYPSQHSRTRNLCIRITNYILNQWGICNLYRVAYDISQYPEKNT